MRSFLTVNKKPILKWQQIPEGTLYKGEVPKGYTLAISPSIGYIIVDIDRHGEKNGFEHIPQDIYKELMSTFNYKTKNKGRHCWFKYTGDVVLACKPSKYGIDIRTGGKGYVCYYKGDDITKHLPEINETSDNMNKWLIKLFYSKTLNK
jgi:hypothetical protein